MKLNKPLKLLLVFLAFTSFANAQNALDLNKADGDTVHVFIDEIQSLVFSEDNFQVITTSGTTETHNFDDVLSLTFVDWVAPDTSSTVSLKLEEKLFLSLYPNPVDDLLFMNIQSEETHNLKLSIIDISGKIVYENSNLHSNTPESINLAHLKQGLYFCRIQNGDSTLTKKIIKK